MEGNEISTQEASDTVTISRIAIATGLGTAVITFLLNIGNPLEGNRITQESMEAGLNTAVLLGPAAGIGVGMAIKVALNFLSNFFNVE